MEYDIYLTVNGIFYSYHRARYWFQEGWLFIECTENGKRRTFPYRNDDSITYWTMEECK